MRRFTCRDDKRLHGGHVMIGRIAPFVRSCIQSGGKACRGEEGWHMYPHFGVLRKSAGPSMTAFVLLGLGLSPAHAQNCGDTVTTDTVLTQDIGPCPGNGLIIERSGVVLDLNGFSITGNGSA